MLALEGFHPVQDLLIQRHDQNPPGDIWVLPIHSPLLFPVSATQIPAIYAALYSDLCLIRDRLLVSAGVQPTRTTVRKMPQDRNLGQTGSSLHVFSLLSRVIVIHCLFTSSWKHLVQFSRSVVSDSLRPHEPQHARPPCPSPTPRVYPNSCPLSRWCHPTISSSFVPFSSCLQSFPTSGSFRMSQLFTSGGQNIGVSASTSVLPMNTQDSFPLGWTGWISLHSKGLFKSLL